MQIYGSKRNEVAEEWNRLHKEELHDLYSSPYAIRLIKRRTTVWTGHVTYRRQVHTVFGVWT